MIKQLRKLPTSLLHCILLSAIFGLVLLLIFLVYPHHVYGAQTDWSNQHFEIPEYFRTRFYDTGNWFPNLAMQLGGGQNIYNFAYYGLFSPVILPSYLFPWMTMATYLQISNILLTLLSVILCYFWLKKWFPPKKAFLLAFLYLMAAPIIFHSHHHIMFVNYFPFLFWGLLSVHKTLEKRFQLSLILSCVCILLTSFFFSVGAFFTILIYAVFLTLHQHQVHVIRQLLRTIFLIGLHLILAAAIAGFLLFPVAQTLLSGRDSCNDYSTLWHILIPSIHLRYLNYSPFSPGMTSISILAIVAFLRTCRSSYRFLSMTFLVLLCVPFLLYLMNGTMYLDPKAYIPFLPLLLLLCGFFLTELQAHQIPLKRTLVLFAIIVGVGIFVNDGITSEKIAAMLDGTCMVIAFLFYVHWKKMKILLIPAISLSVATCVAVNLGDTYMEQKDLDVVYSDEIQTLVDNIAAEDASFYRISNEYHAGDTVNRVWGADYYRSSVYSSIHSPSFSDFYFEQACNENSIRNSAMIVQSKNPIFGILMGEKYIITKSPITRYGMQLRAQEGDYLLYENTLAYPIGFATPHVMTQEELKSTGYPNRLEALLENAVVSTEDLPDGTTLQKKVPNEMHEIVPTYTTSGVTSDQITNIGEGYYVHSKTPFTVQVTLDKPIDAMILLQMHVDNHLGNGSTTGDVSIRINGVRNKLTDPKWKYQNNNNHFQYTLSSNQPIQTLNLEFSAGDYVISDCKMYEMGYDVIQYAAKSADTWNVQHDSIGDDTITGDIQVKQDSWFVLSMPYDDGFHILIDGVETAYCRTDTDFIGCPISAGSHQIQVTYTAPWSTTGKKCSVVGVGITVLCFAGNLFITRYRKRRVRHA